MKNPQKFDRYIILAALVLIIIINLNELSSFLIYLPILIFALYFFPIKLILKKEDINRKIHFIANFITSLILVLPLINFYVDNIFLELSSLVLLIGNIILMYYFYDKNKSEFLNHIVLLFYIAVANF